MKDAIKKWLLIFVGSLTWILTMYKNGLLRDYGYGFWGANGHDGLWHVALASQLAKGSLAMPTFSGYPVKNYHLGFDMLMVVINKITSIQFVDIYFRIIPFFLSIGLGFLVYKFVKEWTKSSSAAFWSTFLVYFGGSFGFVISKGESAFWSQQSISTLINPPLALSFLLLAWGLISLKKLSEKNSLVNYIVPVLVFGTLVEIKAYAGVLAVSGIFLSGFYRFIKTKNKDFLIVFAFSTILSYVLSKILGGDPAGVFLWQPFWFLETMIGLSDRVGWMNFYSALSTYKSGNIFYKLIPAYGLALIIFMVGNFGTRLVAFFDWANTFKKGGNLDWVRVFTYSVVILGTLIPMFFVQTGTPWNTIQFFYYSLFFASIISGVYLSRIKSKLFLTIFVILTIPTTFQTLKYVYLPQRPPAKLSVDEIDALEFLKSQPDGVVLTYPFDEIASKEAENNPPRPLYLYTTTAYVSAFSHKRTYLDDYINLEITGFDWIARKNNVVTFYTEKHEDAAREFLRSNNIKYIYWVKPQRALLGEGNLGITNIYENKTAVIYKVN